MSDYTTQLRFICESYANRNDKPVPQHDVDSIIAAARPKIFDFDYPIFDPDYKETLESKIISHYYTREIGLETVGLFKHHLKNRMREIMPFYNQMYASEKLKFDPFMNTEFNDSRNTITSGKTDTEGTSLNSQSSHLDRGAHADNESGRSFEELGSENRDAAGETQSTGSDTGKAVLTKDGAELHRDSKTSTLVKHSDTPLGSVNGVTAVGDNSNFLSDVTKTEFEPTTDARTSFQDRTDTTETENGTETSDYTTSVEQNENERHGSESSRGSEDSKAFEDAMGESASSTTGREQTEGIMDYFGRTFGKVGSETYSEMLNKFRQTFLNIDRDVIRELENLFMLVW